MDTSGNIPPMHIALAIPSLRTGGGVVPVVMQLATGLADQGHQVDVVMFSLQIGRLERLSPSVRLVSLDPGHDQAKGSVPVEFRNRVLLLDIESPTWLARWKMWLKILQLCKWDPRAAHLFEDVRRTLAMLAYIRQEKPDCILASAPGSEYAVLSAGHFASSPPVLISAIHSALRSSWKPRSKYRLLLPHADRLVAVSQGLGKSLANLPYIDESNVSTIYNPVYSDEMPKSCLASPDHPWIQDPSSPIVLAAGTFLRKKGFASLIRAFGRLSERRSVRLLILGDGKWRQRLEKLVDRLDLNDRVSMPGSVNDPLSYMARAAVFVLSSRQEGFGLVLVEAMACGCPVVSTDCPYGPAEILEGGRWGELVPVGKDAELADAIERTLDNPLPREVLQRRARFFSVDRAIDQYEKLIAEVVADARSQT